MTFNEAEWHYMERPNDMVSVAGRDYIYHGWIVAVFGKRRGGHGVVVEDKHGRLCVQYPAQLSELPQKQRATP